MDQRSKAIVSTTLAAAALLGLLIAFLCIFLDVGVPPAQTVLPPLPDSLPTPPGSLPPLPTPPGSLPTPDGASAITAAIVLSILSNPNINGVVNEGPLTTYDLTPCETGELPSCFFQNPATPYSRPKWRLELAADLPAYLDVIPMLPQDVVVLTGLTPYDCVYWSFAPYLFNSPGVCSGTVVAASLADTISNITTGWAPSTPFTVLMGMNSGCIAEVKAALPGNQAQVATLQFPYMGPQSLYWFLGRTALFTSQADSEAYVVDTRISATMVRTKAETLDPALTQTEFVFKPRNLEIDEALVVPQADFDLGAETYLQTLLDTLPGGYTAEEVPVFVVPPGVDGYDNGATCIDQCANCQVDNRDTIYFGCNIDDLTPGQYLAVYALNHGAYGKAIYSSLSVYEVNGQFGLDSVEVLPSGPDTYQVLVTQTTNAPTAVPAGTEVITVKDVVGNVGLAERMYVQPTDPSNPSFGVSADFSTVLPMKVWLLLP